MLVYNYDKDFVAVSQKLFFSDEEMMELYPLIEEILSHERWDDMRMYKHHLDTRAVHSLQVCCIAWRKATKSTKYDATSVAIGALLHDFFFYDWQNEKANLDQHDIKLKVYSPKLHGFIHPLIAFDNANKFFPHLMNKMIEDIIVKHMWPLTINPPRYRESWLVSLADKRCSLNILKAPKEIPMYLGFKSNNRN